MEAFSRMPGQIGELGGPSHLDKQLLDILSNKIEQEKIEKLERLLSWQSAGG